MPFCLQYPSRYLPISNVFSVNTFSNEFVQPTAVHILLYLAQSAVRISQDGCLHLDQRIFSKPLKIKSNSKLKLSSSSTSYAIPSRSDSVLFSFTSSKSSKSSSQISHFISNYLFFIVHINFLLTDFLTDVTPLVGVISRFFLGETVFFNLLILIWREVSHFKIDSFEYLSFVSVLF